MVNRINLILKAKNITARQFAEEIGIQPSGMSHILSGRNNPSLEFVMKVMRRYPEIDINWLMFGKGEMYELGNIERTSHTATGSPAPTPSLSSNKQSVVDTTEKSDTAPLNPNDTPQKQETVKNQDLDLFSQIDSQTNENATNSTTSQSQDKNTILVDEPKTTLPASTNDLKTILATPELEAHKLEKALSHTDVEMEPTPKVSGNDTDLTPVKNTIQTNPAPIHRQTVTADPEANVQPVANCNTTEQNTKAETIEKKEKKIVKLLVFYDDHTFGEYHPE